LFKINYDFLESIPKDDDFTNIFITHHLPSHLLIDRQYEDSQINQCFASSCEQLMTNNVKYWFYGHTHSASDTTINETRLLCNPVGYPGENISPNINKVIALTK